MLAAVHFPFQKNNTVYSDWMSENQIFVIVCQILRQQFRVMIKSTRGLNSAYPALGQA
jgi:hypothetical protein